MISFICQVTCSEFVMECQELSLQLMLGPRAWLHGVEGHAFCRAHEKWVFLSPSDAQRRPTCKIVYVTIPKHVPDFCTKLCRPELSMTSGAARGPLINVITDSPCTCCRITHSYGQHIPLQKNLAAIQA